MKPLKLVGVPWLDVRFAVWVLVWAPLAYLGSCNLSEKLLPLFPKAMQKCSSKITGQALRKALWLVTVGWASISTVCFQVVCSRYWQWRAHFTTKCCHSCKLQLRRILKWKKFQWLVNFWRKARQLRLTATAADAATPRVCACQPYSPKLSCSGALP